VSSENVVEIDRLSFGYNSGRQVLADINMRIPRGKVVAIMGQSGCGKTTLLRMMGGALRPSSGDVRVFGESLVHKKQAEIYRLRRRMSMLFQFGALFTDMSTFDNVAFPMREHTRLDESMIRDLVLMKLNAVGLRGAAGLRISEVSGGMARRIALARAIALDPELIMYDEPFAGLDPISLGTAARLIRRLNDSLGITSVVVSHDVNETFQIADHVVVLANGKVAAQGTPEALRQTSDPLIHQFVNGLSEGPVHFHYPAKSIAEDFSRIAP